MVAEIKRLTQCVSWSARPMAEVFAAGIRMISCLGAMTKYCRIK